MAEGSLEAKQALMKHNLRLVVRIAKRYETPYIDIEDLISTGTIGLVKAINTYEPAKNSKLSSYASRCIENEIMMFVRKEKRNMGISFEDTLNTDKNGNNQLLSDILGTDENIVTKPMEDDIDKQLLSKAIEALTKREQEILIMRFGLDGNKEHTQKEVADMMGITQSYISRLEKRIFSRLKREITRYV